MNNNTLKNIIDSYIERNSGSNRSRGKQIYKQNGYKLEKIDLDQEIVTYKVDSEFFLNESYTVNITNFTNIHTITANCNCGQNFGLGLCKHIVASLLDFSDRVVNIYPNKLTKHNQLHTEITMSKIDELVLITNSDPADYFIARQFVSQKQIEVVTNDQKIAESNLNIKGEVCKVVLKQIDTDKFVTSCNCSNSNYKLCVHKVMVFLQLKAQYGDRAFELMQNWDEYKNTLLAQYGFSLSDNLQGKFEFTMLKGSLTPELVILDPTLMKISDIKAWGNSFTNVLPTERKNMISVLNAHKSKPKENMKLIIGYAFEFYNRNILPKLKLNVIIGKPNSDETDFVSHVSLLNDGSKNNQLPVINNDDLEIMQIANELESNAIADFARRNTSIKPQHFWELNGYAVTDANANNPDFLIIQSYINAKIKRLFSLFQNKLVYVTDTINNRLSTNTIRKITTSNEQTKLCLVLREIDNFLELSLFLKVNNQLLLRENMQAVADNLLLYNKTLYIIDNADEIFVLKIFDSRSSIKVVKSEQAYFLKNFVLPLQSKCEVDIQLDLAIKDYYTSPIAQVYLKESDEHLIIQPIITYANLQVELDELAEWTYEENGTLIKLKRDQYFEQDYALFIQELHPDFAEQKIDTKGTYYYLSFNEVMKDLWFLKFSEQLKKNHIELFGFKDLSKFKYNLNPPEINMRFSSGIDWFDIKIMIQYGDEMVPLKDVQKALLRKDKFVALKNGTYGVLPEEWIQKYASLFKMGEINKNNTLRLSKLHFSLLAELYEQIDDTSVLEELKEKKQNLNNFHKIDTVVIAGELNNILRDYQKEGYNWLHFLDKFKWGGCLADDMGLGKTLQVLSFINHLKTDGRKGVNLVIAPTSLLFNWEAEVQKFCPNLTVYRHHGSNRTKIKIDNLENIDLVITTYGTVTSDIEDFSNIYFNYVILDESQSIKNPTTNRYKAVRLLKAQNRIALTGTPIENNTFDLYSQMNFLNPGLLGSMEFFKTEFSGPIDKNGDKDKVEELKKIVFPFILRRTKEVVATELPEKTETILFCEMGSKQRKVYDAFRVSYREKILTRISSDGLEKAGMTILEGLMKLRQICDSPLLLSDAEDYGSESVKLNEIMEHITEKTGNHKILVFSQFLEMLALIKKELQTNNIPFEYLDGSTAAIDRKKAVEHFQNNDNCRVFLVSLKAGGVGLNLTAADYVYLVDPWWNPAVEAQAIDRTHRIGQDKHVFAYKMICKDTIEEKIMLLQEKKKALAADLISPDSGFMKQLTRNDIEFLFG